MSIGPVPDEPSGGEQPTSTPRAAARDTDRATPIADATCHQQTIRRELVHRSSISEVFVTSLARLARPHGGAEFLAGAQLPRMHAYFGDHIGAQQDRHDPLAVMETARQAAIALTHEYFDVPLGSAFLVRQFNGVTHRLARHASAAGSTASGSGDVWAVGDRPADLDIVVAVRNRHVVAERLRGLDMVLELSRAGVPLMTVDGSFSWTSPDQWRALRAQARGGTRPGAVCTITPTDPHRVGRTNIRNVVIGEPLTDSAGDPVAASDATISARLVIDTAHPGLFDHDLDHVPGTLMLEACRQLALAHCGTGVRLGSIHATFGRFVELDRPAMCRLVVDRARSGAPGDAGSVVVTISQDDEPCVRATVDLLDDDLP